jgi:hypothetical protein
MFLATSRGGAVMALYRSMRSLWIQLFGLSEGIVALAIAPVTQS